MEEKIWTFPLISLPLLLLLLALHVFFFNRRRRQLPPGPTAYPIIGNLLWLCNSISDLETVIRRLKHRYGQIVTLHIGRRPAIFVFDRTLAHKFLVQHGSVFASRPPALLSVGLIGRTDQYAINGLVYGPLWRLLRRNLMSEILHPSRIKIYSEGRSWVLGVLVDEIIRMQSEEEREGVVVVMEAFQYAMFCLLVSMCFGDKFEKKMVRDIESAQRDLLLYFGKIQIFRFFPKEIAKYMFAGRLKTMIKIRQRQMDIFLPLINSRREKKKNNNNNNNKTKNGSCFEYCYVDSLLDLELPEENGKRLSDDEIVGLCSEFLNGGTDTTSTALQWIMANVVKHQHIQQKLLEEIMKHAAAVEGAKEEIREEDLNQMPYLKAVVMEGLRRHPPGHFVLPHAVTEDIVVDGYLIPRYATVNFMVADMGWDAKLYEEPLEFRPERFLPGGEAEGVDITGSREIKMMPFGAGRRICPAFGLALLHLEYFVANLVKRFDWKEVDGEEIDFSEKREFTIVMKNPLRSRVTPRL